MILLFLALLPQLYWDRGPETANELKQAGISAMVVPPHLEAAWKQAPGFNIQTGDVQMAVKLSPPGVQYRPGEAGPTRSPWIDSNGWRILRNPKARFYYDVPGPGSALAAAESYLFGAEAMVRTDAAGLSALSEMLRFLSGVKAVELRPVADIGFIDDGSPQAGEVMNMFIRRNLLFRTVTSADPAVALNVMFGSERYPKSEAADPNAFAQKVRAELKDERRSLRIYGSEVVIGKLSGNERSRRVQLLNYASGSRPVRGIRVRVLGSFREQQARIFGASDPSLLDVAILPDATEFTIPELKSYAVVDLER